MMFDEEGQAVTTEHKVRIARRAYHLLTERSGYEASRYRLRPEHPDRRHRHGGTQRYAVNFIEAARQIKQFFPR